MNMLRKSLVLGCTLYWFGILSGQANPLWHWLENAETMCAEVTQTQCDLGLPCTEKGYGQVVLKRSARQFKWEMQAPNDLLIVSDGKTVWFYDRVVDQVTIHSLKDFLDQPLFSILFGNRKKISAHYWIREAADLNSVVLQPKQPCAECVQIKLIFKEKELREIQLTEPDQRVNVINFLPNTNSRLTKETFTFRVPVEATVDDQRKVLPGENE